MAGPIALAALAVLGLAGPALTQDLEAYRRLAVRAPDERAIVFRFAPRDSAVVAALASLARAHRPAPLAGRELPPDSFVVVVASTEADFRAAAGRGTPDWGLAVALPWKREVVLRSPRLTGSAGVDPAVVLRHELNHVWIDLAAGSGEAVPRWFNEGFAAVYADEWRWVDPLRLAWAHWTGGLPSLAALEQGFPSTPTPALAYVTSMAAVRSLRGRGGDAGVGLLLERVARGSSFDAALRATYGLTLAQFYDQWRTRPGDASGGPLLLLADERAPWIVLALFVAGFWLVRRRGVKREIAERKRREDAALGQPGDHGSGVEEWEREWESEDDRWRGREGDTIL